MRDVRAWWVLGSVLVALAIVGFLYGTSDSDYVFETPLTVWEEGPQGDAPVATTYSEERALTTSDGSEVADECSDCHPERVNDLRKGQRTEHPVDVPVPPGARLTLLLASGGRLEQAGEHGPKKVVCRSCHRPHNVTTDARLIVTTDEGALCVSCHADHRAARSKHPIQVRISAETRAAIEGVGGVADGKLTCLSCHDPHGSSAGTLLRTTATGASACGLCHDDKSSALGQKGHGAQSCIDCHGMHTASRKRGRGPPAPEPQDQGCVDCHVSGQGSTLQVELTGGHPMSVEVPLGVEGHAGMVSCSDCHTAHTGRRSVLAKAGTGKVCVHCHPDQASVVGTDHDGSVVKVAGSNSACVTCHDVHGPGRRPPAPGGVNPASGRCLACHDGRTKATQVREWTHPEGLLLTTDGLPFRYSGSVPYFGPDGRRTQNQKAGEIACQTCHDPHRWKAVGQSPRGPSDGTEQDSFLRSQAEVIKLCTVCHGVDGRPRFRFFHGDQYREAKEGGK